MTRRQQLSKKAEKKGKGRGKGKKTGGGKGKGRGKGKKQSPKSNKTKGDRKVAKKTPGESETTEAASSSIKKSKTKKSRKGKKVKKNKVQTTPEEITHHDDSQPSGSKCKKPRKAKLTEKTSDAKHPPASKKRPASQKLEKPAPSSSSRARKGKGAVDEPKEDLSQNFNETKIANIMYFIQQVDYESLELDDLKQNILHVLPELSKCTLNKYWTRQACGVTMDGANVGTFSVPKNIDCTPSLRTVVSIAVALQLVSW